MIDIHLENLTNFYIHMQQDKIQLKLETLSGGYCYMYFKIEQLNDLIDELKATIEYQNKKRGVA